MSLTDFNDMAAHSGLEAVRRAVANASAPAAGEAAPILELAPAGNAASTEGWPEPQALIGKVAPEPYPVDALPQMIRAAVEEVQAFTKAPFPLVASSALGALSLAIQTHADVKRTDKLSGPVSLFLLTIADSGERKSTCDGFFTAAIRQYENEQTEAAKPVLQRYAADMEAWEAERAGIKAAIKDAGKKKKPIDGERARLAELQAKKPQAPKVPKLIRGDDTPENLAWALTMQWPSAGVISSEAGAILGAHGMGKESVMRNLGLLNILWDGGSLPIGRRTSESFTLKGARFTVALQIQEATLRSFFDQSRGLARGIGFMARFLVAWPESTQGERLFEEAPANWPHLAAFNRRIADILALPVPMEADSTLAPPKLPLSPDAKAAWVEFHDAIEVDLKRGGELYEVRDVASKAADNAARLAALFHVFEHGAGAVGADAFGGAARVVAWHLSESRRFFGELALPPELGDAVRLDSWLIEYCRQAGVQAVTRRIAQNKGPVRDGKRLDAALLELIEAGRAQMAAKTIQIHPALTMRGVP